LSIFIILQLNTSDLKGVEIKASASILGNLLKEKNSRSIQAIKTLEEAKELIEGKHEYIKEINLGS